MNEPAPILLFVYNRPEHTQLTLQSLKNNHLAPQSSLFIFSDGPKNSSDPVLVNNIKKVREVIQMEKWCGNVEIQESETNNSLPVTMVNRVTEFVEKYGKVIVLEDDLILSPGFLTFMNDALKMYENEEKVWHISGYMFPLKEKLPDTLFYNTNGCWGWATWQRAWKHFEHDANGLLKKIQGKKNIERFNIENNYDYYEALQNCAKGPVRPWAIRWYATLFVNGAFSLHPGKSLVRNIGHDNTGLHCGMMSVYSDQEIADSVKVQKVPIVESKKARKGSGKFLHYYYMPKNIPFRIVSRLKKTLRMKEGY